MNQKETQTLQNDSNQTPGEAESQPRLSPTKTTGRKLDSIPTYHKTKRQGPMNGLMMPQTGRELVWNILGKLQVSEHRKTVLREPRDDKRKWYGWWILGLLINFQQIVSNLLNTQSIATKIADKRFQYVQCNLPNSCTVGSSQEEARQDNPIST